MKAIILAAGLGTRLRPLTNEIPKCLVPIGDKPLLWYHISRLHKFGVDNILVNTHYLPDKVEDFLKNYQNYDSKGLIIQTSFEIDLLGSAGTLRENKSFFLQDDIFLVVYGDNLTNIDYKKLIDYHLEKKGICTIACYEEKNISSKGMVVFDEDNKITSFVEKPTKEKIISNYANAGIYVFDKKIFDYLSTYTRIPFDIGHDLFSYNLIENENVFAYLMDEYLLDIGTLETYDIANKQISKLIF